MQEPFNPRQEAHDRLGGRYEVRVLEPSPPTVDEPPWFADDPAAPGEVPPGRRLVSPVSNGDLLWDDLAAGDEELAAWCADRWLGAWRRLGPVPPGLEGTRRSLHRLAEEVISPTRQRVTGKIGLRFTRGGFGTPFFGADVQVRVEGDVLVVVRENREWRGRITTLRDAAEFIGHELTRFDAAIDDGPLPIEGPAARFLGDWYGFGASVLEQLRAECPDDEPSRVQLWPEHFDIAVELGSEADGARAGYGCSPGDDDHPEPYCYVTPWSGRPDGDLWQATAFEGAELPFSELLGAEDQRGAALDFFRVRLRALLA